jgi:hypothetical protein
MVVWTDCVLGKNDFEQPKPMDRDKTY